MNPTQSDPSRDDAGDSCGTIPNSAAAKLAVCESERLDYAEIPATPSTTTKPKRRAALLEAMYYWVLSRS